MKKTFLYILAAGLFGGVTLMSFDGGAQTAEQQIAAKVEAAKATYMAEQDAACKAKAVAAAQAEFAAATPVVEEPVVDPKSGKTVKPKPTPTPTPAPSTNGGTSTPTDAQGGNATVKPTDPKASKISGDKTTTTDAKTSKISGDGKSTTTDAKSSKIKGGN